MKIYWDNMYAVIEEDFKYQIDSKYINKIINNLLKKWKLITKDIERCIRHDNFLIICPYGPLTNNTLIKVIKKIVESKDISYELSYRLPENVREKLNDILPVSTNYKGTISGGITVDSKEIDDGVKCLVDAINTFDGIVTFSSCEGHPPDNKLYVLFHCEKIENIDKFSYYIDKYISVLWDKYNLDDKKFFVHLLYEYGKWKHMTGVFFEIRINYNNDIKDFTFKVVEELSWLIKEALLKEI